MGVRFGFVEAVTRVRTTGWMRVMISTDRWLDSNHCYVRARCPQRSHHRSQRRAVCLLATRRPQGSDMLQVHKSFPRCLWRASHVRREALYFQASSNPGVPGCSGRTDRCPLYKTSVTAPTTFPTEIVRTICYVFTRKTRLPATPSTHISHDQPFVLTTNSRTTT